VRYPLFTFYPRRMDFLDQDTAPLVLVVARQMSTIGCDPHNFNLISRPSSNQGYTKRAPVFAATH
jgi:hypothetical protein